VRTARMWLTVIMAAGGLLIAASPAIAAEAGSAATAQAAASRAVQVATPFHICLKNATTYCLRSNGGGQQVTITNNPANYSTFHQPLGGQYENASGNCLRAGTGNIVKIENGGCSATDQADTWYAPVGMTFRVRSELYTDDMLVHGVANGNSVWHATPVSGDWYNWISISI